MKSHVPQLLDMLGVSDCIVTADAMSCQKEITKKIIEKDAEYVLSLKGNQPMLCHEMQEYFSEAVKAAEPYPKIEQHKTLDCGHGRIEKRTHYLSTEAGWYQELAQWAGIRGFGILLANKNIGNLVVQKESGDLIRRMLQGSHEGSSFMADIKFGSRQVARVD